MVANILYVVLLVLALLGFLPPTLALAVAFGYHVLSAEQHN